jgi:hypothetical protein
MQEEKDERWANEVAALRARQSQVTANWTAAFAAYTAYTAWVALQGF